MSAHNAIRLALKRGEKVSQLSVLRDYGCMRLAPVIYRLRGKGMEIVTDYRNQGGKKYAVYRAVLPADERNKK